MKSEIDLIKCPECQSTHANKNGQKRGKQNHICIACRSQFIDCYKAQQGYSEKVERECLIKLLVHYLEFWDVPIPYSANYLTGDRVR